MRIGVDIVYIPRVKALLDRFGRRFINRVLTEEEMLREDYAYIAGRIACKEAVFKAVSPPLGYIRWKEIEVLSDGRPGVKLNGSIKEFAEKKGMRAISVSLSHDGDYVIAFAVVEV